MKFIELHYNKGDDSCFLNPEKVISMRRGITKTYGGSWKETEIETTGSTFYCMETPEEIIQKIAETEQRERSFMDDWEKEVEDPLSRLSRLKAKKDGESDATDRW